MPFSGNINIEKVEKEFDYFFVDIFDRPYACDTPDGLEKDDFIFGPRTCVNQGFA